MEGIIGVSQLLRVDALLRDAFDVPAALAHCVVAGAPAATAQLVPVGAEDAMVMSVHQIQLGQLVQESEIGFEADGLAVLGHNAPAQAVHGGDADGG